MASPASVFAGLPGQLLQRFKGGREAGGVEGMLERERCRMPQHAGKHAHGTRGLRPPYAINDVGDLTYAAKI
jgi:hypothetical protein